MKLNVKLAKESFFDSEKVIKATSKAERKVLSKFGAFVMTTARRSMRKRKKSSEPGQPPSAHVGLIKKFLYFVWDAEKKSVVIGPALLNGTKSRDTLTLMEHGGTASRRFAVVKQEKGKKGRGNKSGATRLISAPWAKPQQVKYPARPFMRPALSTNLPKLPEMWRDSVKPG